MLKEKYRKLYCITIVLFAIYLLFIVWIILFKLEFSLNALEKSRVYNFIPFHYEENDNIRFHYSEVIGNVQIFIPLGMYLCLLFKKIPFWGKMAFVLAFSLALECSQYVLAVGRFDVTDLITNTVGGLVGACICMIGCALIRDKAKAERIAAVLMNAVAVLLVGGLLLISSLN